MVSRQCFVECGGNSHAGWHEEPIQAPVGYFHGLASSSEWTGIPLSILLDEAGLQPEARWLVAEGADAGAMNVSIPIEKALDDTLLALYQNGERIRPEQGYPMRLILPGFEAVLYVGVFAPARTPSAVINRINQEILRVLPKQDIKEKMLNAGMETVGSTPDQFAAIIKTDIARWDKVIKEAGIKLEQ